MTEMQVICIGVQGRGNRRVYVRCVCAWQGWLGDGLRSAFCRVCEQLRAIKPMLTLAEADVAYPEVQKEHAA